MQPHKTVLDSCSICLYWYTVWQNNCMNVKEMVVNIGVLSFSSGYILKAMWHIVDWITKQSYAFIVENSFSYPNKRIPLLKMLPVIICHASCIIKYYFKKMSFSHISAAECQSLKGFRHFRELSSYAPQFSPSRDTSLLYICLVHILYAPGSKKDILLARFDSDNFR